MVAYPHPPQPTSAVARAVAAQAHGVDVVASGRESFREALVPAPRPVPGAMDQDDRVTRGPAGRGPKDHLKAAHIRRPHPSRAFVPGVAGLVVDGHAAVDPSFCNRRAVPLCSLAIGVVQSGRAIGMLTLCGMIDEMRSWTKSTNNRTKDTSLIVIYPESLPLK